MFADTRYVLYTLVVIRCAIDYDTKRGPSSEPDREAISVVENSIFYWELRSSSLFPRDAALLRQVTASCDKQRLVLGHGSRKRGTIETLALMRHQPCDNIVRVDVVHEI